MYEYEVFFIIGAVLILGFATSLIFERTKFPDVILLMFVGILIGPILNIVSIEGAISDLAPYIGTLALIIMLFDGGMNLNLFKVLTSFSKATVFTLVVFILSLILVGFSMNLFFGWTYLEGFLLGAVVGGTSSAIVMSVISKLSMSEDSKVILSLESALTDALCIIIALALIDIILLGTVDLRSTAGSIASAFTTAGVIAILFAVFWIGIINRLIVKPVGYSMTLAVVFILYSLVDLVKSNGAIAVFIFALLLSNFNDVAKRFSAKGMFELDNTLRAFQVEVSFFVRTFFFIFIGLMFNMNALNATVIAMSVIVFIVLLIARALGVKMLVLGDRSMAPYERSMTYVMPRGLAAAVLASLPLAAGLQIPYFAEVAFSILILTNLATTFGVVMVEKNIKIEVFKIKRTA